MRKGSRKYGYNWVAFGQRVKHLRMTLGWSYRQLGAQMKTPLNVGSLRHIEAGARSLPEAHRLTLIDILSDACNRKRITVSRKDFLALAGLAVGGLITLQVSDLDVLPLTASSSIDDPASYPSNAKEVAPEPSQLEAKGRWAEVRLIRLARAAEAKRHEAWDVWASSLMDAGLMSLTLGRLEEAGSYLDTVLHAPADVARALDPAIRAEAHRRRGWLDLELLHYGPAIAHLTKDREILRQLDPAAQGSLHFLGKTYCSWGIAEDNAVYRAWGIALFQRAFAEDKQIGNIGSMGYDALQQVSCLMYDDNLREAQRRTSEGYELLGIQGTAAGHHQMNYGRMEYYRNPKKSLEHFQLAQMAYSTDLFYAKGLASSLFMLCSFYTDESKTIPKAAEYALIAACAHPYRQRLENLESVATRVYFSFCDRALSRFERFWREMEERVWRMDTDPFSSLTSLYRTVNGPERLREAMQLAHAAIARGLPQHLALAYSVDEISRISEVRTP